MLRLTNLTFKRDTQVILKNLSYQFSPGSITCIVGPSGSGKSTLLACLTQLLTDYEGSIQVDLKELKELTVKERAQEIGIVFQDWQLFPLLTALDNVAQPLRLSGLSAEDAQTRAQQLLVSFGMDGYEDAISIRLSGGQQQRIALARALALNPRVLCLDEPTSALDSRNRSRLRAELIRLKEAGITLIITSHDDEFVASLADMVLELNDGMLSPYEKQDQGLS